jgi:dihydroorotase-like cyclic amidohydrolase
MKNLALALLSIIMVTTAFSQIAKAPERKEGDGPYTQLIIRGVNLINGTGAPAIGPVDIVIEKNRIVSVNTVGSPGVAINPNRRPKLKDGGKEMNCEGMYVLPGLIDMHGHIGGTAQGTPAEYVFKLWMAHGITTIRDPSAGNGIDWVLDQKQKSADNKITAPRIYAYTAFGAGAKQPIITKEQAIDWVRENATKGADGIKFFGASPVVMDAALRENKKLGLRSACHHAQMDVGRWNV